MCGSRGCFQSSVEASVQCGLLSLDVSCDCVSVAIWGKEGCVTCNMLFLYSYQNATVHKIQAFAAMLVL